ncbi:hypothetical protein AHMF7605_19675 [Adhaeribacter arboris]|uniref:Uncharacterized protein n=2 Tax=Adhaeribacter arboris TaxID=2072846 RepID=A0A2T2YJ81_9BACT|nr:Na+/H+ antiporter NhaA [Adhaeribacter arboris]PSR55566.1 hypothetical protein AHMF7605_19675 [Adhaeribacter arboris]
MAIFFLLVGPEIEREIYIGELSNLKNALLPVLAAIGSMAILTLFYYLFNVCFLRSIRTNKVEE